MPRAFDRRTPASDKNPLANLLDFENWAQSIDETAEDAGEAIRQFTINVGDVAAEAGKAVQQFLTNVADGLGMVTEELEWVFTNLVRFFQSIDFTSPDFDPQAAAVQFVNIILHPTGLVLDKNSPLNSLNLFNLVPTDLMAQISHSAIGEAITNLIADPFFQDADGFNGLDEWWHELTGGHNGTGAAKTTADGTTKELLGNLIPASQGQVMPIKGKAKWSGLLGTGNPVQLAITGYNSGGAAVDQQIIASHNTTPPTTDWLDLIGQYVVPAGVSSIRTRLVVAPSATAGDVWFSNLSATKTNPMFQRLIAGQNAGENLTNDIEGLFTGIVSNTMALVNKAGLTDFNNLVAGLGGSFGNQIADAVARMNTFLNSASPLNADRINTGSIADQFVPGLGTINDSIVTQLSRITGSGFGNDALIAALQQNVFAAVDTSARVAQLEMLLTGGIAIQDDFERTSSTNIGANWLHSQTGAGKWAIPNGHDATWIASGTADCDFLEIYNTGPIRSTTDLQRLTMVLSSKATVAFGKSGANDLWLRISDDTTSIANVTGIRVRWRNGTLEIARFLGGVQSAVLASVGGISDPGPGSMPWAEAGTPGVARYFRAGIGTATLLEVTEIGTASGVGATFRRWGHGGHADDSIITQERPGGLKHWTGKDQVA